MPPGASTGYGRVVVVTGGMCEFLTSKDTSLFRNSPTPSPLWSPSYRIRTSAKRPPEGTEGPPTPTKPCWGGGVGSEHYCQPQGLLHNIPYHTIFTSNKDSSSRQQHEILSPTMPCPSRWTSFSSPTTPTLPLHSQPSQTNPALSSEPHLPILLSPPARPPARFPLSPSFPLFPGPLRLAVLLPLIVLSTPQSSTLLKSTTATSTSTPPSECHNSA